MTSQRSSTFKRVFIDDVNCRRFRILKKRLKKRTLQTETKPHGKISAQCRYADQEMNFERCNEKNLLFLNAFLPREILLAHEP